MRTLKCTLDGCVNSGYDTLMMQTSEGKADTCFLEDFKAWNGGGALPTGSAFLAKLKEFRSCANPNLYSSDVIKGNYMEDIGFVDGKLRYVAVRFRSTMSNEEPYGTGTKVRDLMSDFVASRKAASPSSMSSIKLSGGFVFAQFDNSAELLSGLFAGCAIAGPMAFLVLLVSTQNIVTALYATSAVGSIVLCVLGFCKSAMDWDLGAGEAIAGVVVIGYSVDYVVHLAHVYSEAGEKGMESREERAKFAVANMGSTVFAGAITTAASGAVLFFTFFYFFFKMALLICVTIMYSFLFSLGFFMGLMFLIGPQGRCGDLRYMCGWLCGKFRAGGQPAKKTAFGMESDVNELSRVGPK
jgi:hypothetical protein